MNTSTKRRARQKAAPQAVTTTTLSCEVCHIPGDETTLKNWGTESLPYWMCAKTSDCDARAWGAHAEADQDPAPEPEAAQPEAAVAEPQPEPEAPAAEETAEATG